jgi:hypothetical protein
MIFRQITYPVSVEEAYHRAVTAPGSASADVLTALASSGLPMPSGQGLRVGDYVVEAGGSVYRSTFAPSARRAEDAGAVTVGAGETRTNVDIRIPTERAFLVAGIARSPAGPAVRGAALDARGRPGDVPV